MTTVIDTPDGIAAARLLAVYKALQLEVRTGLKNSRFSLLAIAQSQYGVTRRTKAGALKELKALYPEVLGNA